MIIMRILLAVIAICVLTLLMMIMILWRRLLCIPSPSHCLVVTPLRPRRRRDFRVLNYPLIPTRRGRGWLALVFPPLSLPHRSRGCSRRCLRTWLGLRPLVWLEWLPVWLVWLPVWLAWLLAWLFLPAWLWPHPPVRLTWLDPCRELQLAWLRLRPLPWLACLRVRLRCRSPPRWLLGDPNISPPSCLALIAGLPILPPLPSW